MLSQIIAKGLPSAAWKGAHYGAPLQPNPARPTPASPAGPVILPAHLLAARSAKVRDHHLDRTAVVYVRQSTPQQVTDHQESTARQYALADRAVELGWPGERVTVIDDDLGKSGQSVEGRPGFQRLLAEVALDHVGLILGLETSRLARSCRDWHQLLERSAPSSAPCWPTRMASTTRPITTTGCSSA